MEKKDVLVSLQGVMDRRPGSADSDVNMFMIEYAVPYWLLDNMRKEIERLRSLAGAVSAGPTASELYHGLRHPSPAADAEGA